MEFLGYGIRTDNITLTKEAEFVNKYILSAEYFNEMYREYCEDNDLDPADDESKCRFVEDYENETYCWNGFEGLITDVINYNRGAENNTFRHEDCCIYVEATVPATQKEKDSMLTQEDIRDILTEYVNPFVKGKEPLVIGWYTIHDE